MSAKLPAIRVDQFSGGLRVVRDDIVPGGTKARALIRWLPEFKGQEFVYASPRQGFAQLALAFCASALRKRATIFVAQSQELHPITREAQRYGAKIVQVPMGFLSNVTAKAKRYCAESGATLMPFGLHDERFVEHLSDVARESGERPREVWCVAASGTLALALSRAWPRAKLNVVRVGAIRELPKRCTIYHAPERYEQSARRPPPWDACDNYEAKAWQFIIKHAARDALFWNVAGNITGESSGKKR